MFNPNARWDRHLPHEPQHIGEPIQVGVVFKKGQLFPRWFIWNNHKYNIQQITYRWKDKQGQEERYFFSVSDGVNIYQIYLNNKQMNWRLNKICPI